MTSRSMQLFEQLLVGHRLTVSELDELVSHNVKEDQYLDYKHGNELLKSDASKTIREYTSAFANSVGGILIVGVDAPDSVPLVVTGCDGHGRGNLDDWVSRCLTKIASYFTPYPQYYVVDHPNGEVLVIVIPRSLRLVPETEAGRIIYHFRFHDQTLKAPDFLISDLLLGRRQQPILEVGELRTVKLERYFDNEKDLMDLQVTLALQFENKDLVWANGVIWGVIAWIQNTENRYGDTIVIPSNHLLSYIEVRDIQQDQYLRSRNLRHFSGGVSIEKPFDVRQRRIYFTIPLHIHNKWFAYTWRAALYLMSKDSLPIWYQVSFEVNIHTVKYVTSGAQLRSSDGEIRVDRLVDRRPVVEWKDFRTVTS